MWRNARASCMTSKRKFLTAGLLFSVATVISVTLMVDRSGKPQTNAASDSQWESPKPVTDGEKGPSLSVAGEESAAVPPSPPHKAQVKKPNGRDLLKKIADSGSPAEWQAFLDSAAPASAKEALLECIGETARPEASAFLKAALNAETQGLRRAAIRGLAATGTPADAAVLRDILGNSNLAIEETTEAALALGGTKAANASGFLINAYSKTGSEELNVCILVGLAQRPIQESESFFRQMLADPSESSSRKKEALESLGQFDSVKDVFFLPFMESSETDVRRGAYQGLGKLAESQMGYLLLNYLQKEKEELARADIYEALTSKNSGNLTLLNQMAGAETDPLIRLIAGQAVACSLRGAPEADPLVAVFQRQWVPEFTERALRGGSQEGMQAVFALMSAPSFTFSRQALEQIGAEADDLKVRELAQKALKRLNKTL